MRIRLMTITLFLIVSFLSSCNGTEDEKEVRYQNPIALEDEWEEYGLGDPFVMKHNGMYYLYVSTRDTDIGVKAWSSMNLVDWQYEGLVTEEPETRAAYAPEVIYWNGYFYMYTSPAGQGHYILKSESPTGPFHLASQNLGKSIDGSVFIDDDGSMYFSHAGTDGIEVAPMSDPLTIGTSILTDAYMDGWTEGSTIFKRNGKYYMTYTGNHVFSDAYRIDYAVSEHPIEGYQLSDQNPIIINTEGSNVGLGHNSVVKGPNLDEDYIIYHNLEGPGIVGPLRHMNIDRIAWNGDKMLVLGPTFTEQQGPASPVFEERFNRGKLGNSWEDINGGEWGIENQTYLRQTATGSTEWHKQVIKEATANDYTAEFHGKMVNESLGSSSQLYGAVFSYQNENNYGVALFSPSDHALLARFTVDGQNSDWFSSELPEEFDFTKLHQIRVEKSSDSFEIYVDGMHQLSLTAALDGGKIGYMTEDVQVDFGYIAFSNDVNGSSVWDVYKPLPGTVQAIHYKSGGQGEGYHVLNEENKNGEYRYDAVAIQESEDGGYSVSLKQQEEWLAYLANVSKEGTYHLDLRFATEDEDTELRIWQADQDISGTISLSNTGGGAQSWRTITVKDLELSEGQQELKVELVQGEVHLAAMTFYEADTVEQITENFTEGLENEWMMYEGYWSARGGIFQPSERNFSKALVGKAGWTDYTVEVDVSLNNTDGDAGILVRGMNAANGAERNQNNGDFLQGYYAFINADGVHLGKQNYGWENLASVSAELPEGIFHQMKVVVNGGEIQVFVNDMDSPKIVYEDTSPYAFTHGRVGLRNSNGIADFARFNVTAN
ncbi:family 43 glycosylhydrolase [Alkalihalobacillus sp. 1P02AB]|uniref:family 43 glycosylhydrolase n=1 Tax=Alkalihalobacillus sp. 1P02AB TaxID=3132260 RepID=UPI0039A639A0